MSRYVLESLVMGILYFAFGWIVWLLAGVLDLLLAAYFRYQPQQGPFSVVGLLCASILGVGMLCVTFGSSLLDDSPTDSQSAEEPSCPIACPRFTAWRRWVRSPEARLTLILGVPMILAWYASTMITVWISRRPATAWTPPNLFGVILVLWGLCWMADGLSAKSSRVTSVAFGFLLIAGFFCQGGGMVVWE